MPRRSYAHYCAIARSLDVLGERWTLLIVRELVDGPRRYTELHADLPGISTDVLAARLKEMERDGLVERRRVAPPTPAWVYGLTARGRDLLPVLGALAAWGGGLLGTRGPTDALRGHWLALPLATAVQRAMPGLRGVAEFRVDGARCRVRFAGGGAAPAGDHSAQPDAVLTVASDTAAGLISGRAAVTDALAGGQVAVSGDSSLAAALRAVPVAPG